MKPPTVRSDEISGELVTLEGERYYVIRNVDAMPPFFVSVVSDRDHWLFMSSTGGLAAGRVSPDKSLLPYITVDKIHDSARHTGSQTILRVGHGDDARVWEPFHRAHDGRYDTTRNLYKNVLGNKVCLEEVNHDLRLAFRYWWLTSDTFGFVRRCELENLGDGSLDVDVLDGLRNILPAGTPRFAQTNTSNLVDAYKWTELLEDTGVGLYTLYSGITDRAEPCESLEATTVFCLGLPEHQVLLSAKQVDGFRSGLRPTQETHTRGIRGDYWVSASTTLSPTARERWQLVADLEQSQADVVSLQRRLADPAGLAREIDVSIAEGTDALARLMAGGDAFQLTAEETVTAHHYANVLFNILRGGTFDDQYQVSADDFRRTIAAFNREVFARHRSMLDALPDRVTHSDLQSRVEVTDDPQLLRLCLEYLPIRFGRRHGDPSRPWNQFAIELEDEQGEKILSYQGNWRDIFQNWEALAYSYPEFIESMIAKFLNATTADGYNPYRISKAGIDWEVEDPEDPWSYIGYWGDHQIIYLLKLLELSQAFHPERLARLMRQRAFSFANVPYRIKPFESLVEDAKNTVDYDADAADRIEGCVAQMGADGKLLLDGDGGVYQTHLFEKLLVPLLSKLGNFVVEGGIWLNTQRPEWNDANNALVGHGVSMVTLYYMRRYVAFLQELLGNETGAIAMSPEVGEWLVETAGALRDVRGSLGDGTLDGEARHRVLARLGAAASRYRGVLYEQQTLSTPADQSVSQVLELLGDALAAIDHSIGANRREDGMYHAYNLLDLRPQVVDLERLYPMLEGQVAALSSGAISPNEAAELLETMFESDIFRPDVDTFMLYPDRSLPRFLDRNQVPSDGVKSVPLLLEMLRQGDTSVVVEDENGAYRFHPDLKNAGALDDVLDALASRYGDAVESARAPILALYEHVFHHKAFTGRSGTMFGFEGLGCVYWHMVSKLLLAVQECFFSAARDGADHETRLRLGRLYYRVRQGLGFNKTPREYGAFPMDPYSHTPKHAGAQQPGMTGQVKEEILTRFGELGVRVTGGRASFDPELLRAQELIDRSMPFRFLDVDGEWRTLDVPESGLAFTWCQVPVVYRLDDAAALGLIVTLDDGAKVSIDGRTLPHDLSAELFGRTGRVRRVDVVLTPSELFPG